MTQATLFAYQLPFKTAMQFKATTLTQRHGLILRLIDNQNRPYFTEIAPLTAFSRESLEEVTTELLTLLSGNAQLISEHQSIYPSVQFALDSLCYTPQKQTLNINNIPLLQGNEAMINTQYHALHKPNLVKLKVARESVTSDIQRFQMLCHLNPHLKIRCDANQAWQKQQAEQFFNEINIAQLDYIEEPTSDHQTNLQLAEQYHVKLALDETLQQPHFHYQHHHCIKALIIKPTLIGGRKQIAPFITQAKKHDLQVSFSASFESVIGLQQIKKLALYYQQDLPVSLGIDTLKYFDGTELVDEKQISLDCLALEQICNLHY